MDEHVEPGSGAGGPEPLPPSRSGAKLRRMVNFVGAVMLLALCIVWSLTYLTTRRMAESARRVSHTQEVIASIRGAAAAMQQAEAAHRDYLLSGSAPHRSDYRRALGAHEGEIRRLRTLTRDNARQQVRLDSLDRLTATRTALLDTLAQSLRTNGPEAAQSQVAAPAGQRFIFEIANLLLELETEENLLLRGRLEEADHYAGRATAMVMVTGVFTLLILLGTSVIVHRDITRQERTERDLRRALRAADAASEAKSQFLATVSHEIRTPLNAVAGMTELLLETDLDSEQTEFARTVHANAEALSVLIGDLLDSSKIEAGQVDLEAVPFDLREMVESVAEILVVRAEIKGVELVIDLAPDLPSQLVGDRNRLRQVLMNLVGNAVKFTEEGEVAVRVRSEPEDAGRAARIHVAVCDTGIGIPAEAQQQIFKRFVQAERSTVRRYGGTGLGLNISRSLLELMGGSLSVESEPGQGSTFHVHVALPVAAPAPADVREALRGVEVLLVEPNPTRRHTLHAVLEYAGARVRSAATPGEALEHPLATGATGTPVAVIGDALGGVGALALAQALREAAPGSRPAVVLLCSLRSMMTSQVGRHGITHCVYKPVKPVRLLHAVRQAAGIDVAAAGAIEEALPEPVRGAGVRPRILLAEDHRDNWNLATRLLVAAGYEVELAENGEQAVDRASAFRYDLVLMDVEMPVMDGIEATRRIRAWERESGRDPLPIVALTAHAVEQVRSEALAAGMDDYTTKPLRKQQLLDVCARWVDPRPVVLVADDSPENHVLIANYLGGSDYRLVSVYNGRDAVETFERRRVSLVLLDMDMPVMNGYDAARAIRRATGGDDVPIVALTGYEGAEERQRCLRAGCTAYFTKPIHRAELVEAVASLLGQPSTKPGPQPSPARRPQPHPDPAPESSLPRGREAASRVRSLLARHDFESILELAEEMRFLAGTHGLHKLATVSEELAGGARQADEPRTAWWGEQLTTALREAERVLEVRRRTLPGPNGSESFDRLSRLARELLHVPAAAVTLVDEELLRIKGGAGLAADLERDREMPVSHSFCRHVAARGELLLVEDSRADPLVRDSPAIEEHGVAAYAGVPLTTERGVTLGSFCAIDDQPRHWTAEDVAILQELGAVAMRQMELERQVSELGAQEDADEAGRGRKIRSPAGSAGPVVVVVDDDIADLLPDYVASRRQNVESIRRHLEQGDFGSIERLGHNMKGSGEGYGLPEVSRLGQALERAAKEEHAGDVSRWNEEMGSYLSRLVVRSADGQVVPRG